LSDRRVDVDVDVDVGVEEEPISAEAFDFILDFEPEPEAKENLEVFGLKAERRFSNSRICYPASE
jgi:hypothetical protein